VEREPAGGGGDDDALVVGEVMVRFAERDEVGELGLAAVGPVADVVGVDAAGLAAGVAAAVQVAFADRAPQRRRRLAGAAAGVEDVAVGRRCRRG
jgi:hypothetical protein